MRLNFSVFFFSFSTMSLQTRCQFLNRSSYLSGCVCCGRYDTHVLQGINHVIASSGILKSDNVCPTVHCSVCLMNVRHTEYFRHYSSDFHWTLMNDACPYYSEDIFDSISDFISYFSAWCPCKIIRIAISGCNYGCVWTGMVLRVNFGLGNKST